MEAHHMDECRRYGIGASVVIPAEGDSLGEAMAATISMSTAALAVLSVVGVCACAVLAWGQPHEQDAELARAEDECGRLAAAA